MIEKLQRVTEGQYSVMEMGDKINQLVYAVNDPIWQNMTPEQRQNYVVKQTPKE